MNILPWILLTTGFFASLSAAPAALDAQRSRPMGNTKPSRPILAQAVPASSPNQFLLQAMPVRFQWFANNGYCGEVSLISAGLKYGQYVSQYTVRKTIGSQADDQVLLGVNDDAAAEALHLQYVQWNQQNTHAFLTWVKAYVLNGYPVIMGVYTNECLFYGKCKSSSGDSEYDHIVPVLGILSSQPLTPPSLPPSPLLPYIGSDSIIFSDNGLQGPVDNPIHPPCLPNPANPYQFTYTFDQFQATRAQANKNNQWYSLSSNTHTYGIAILGIRDDGHNTIPVTVVTNAASSCAAGQAYVNYEYPSIKDGSNTKPVSMPLTLTVTVTIPDQSQVYKLYLYNDLSKIPNSQFNAHAGNAVQTWTIPAHSGSTYVITQNITSDAVAAYRAVPSTAP